MTPRLSSLPAIARGASVLLLALGLGCGGDSPVGPGDSSGTEVSTGSSTTGTPTTLDTSTGPGELTSSSTTAAVDDTGTSSSSGAPSSESSSGPGSTSSDGDSSSGGGSSSGGSSDSGSTGSSGASEGESSSGGDEFVCPPAGGQACTDPIECASNACFVVGPLGGVCSECDEDADCAWGCTPANPLTGDCASCCDGSQGCGCQTDAACQAGLTCRPILDIPGILTHSACGQCDGDADCAAGELCAPNYRLDQLLGQYVCVPPGTRLIDEGCEEPGSGDAQCASGSCAPAALMGIPLISVCSACDEDTDCAAGQTCSLPEVVINGNTLEIASGFCG